MPTVFLSRKIYTVDNQIYGGKLTEMAEKRKVGALSVDEALKSFIEVGCGLDVDGSRKTLIDLNGNPVVEIDLRNKRAVFLDKYHQTAGVIGELQDLVAALDAAKIEVSMD